VALVITACGRKTGVTAEVQAETGVVCADLHVPHAWEVTRWGDFEFRRGERLLMGAFYRKGDPQSGPRLYSRYRYALVRNQGGYALEPTSQDEWNGAEPLMRYSDIVYGGDRLRVKVGDRSYRYPGPLPAVAVMSRMMNFPDPIDGLAIGGFDGTESHGDLGALLSSPADGRYLLDLYQASTGRKYATITGEYHSINPGELLGRSFWIEGPWFILPLEVHRDLRHLLVCDLP